uniref:Artemin n=1 Tax=Myripristis murdjan TaxID=586833 RepID=A0A667Y551_9TELE
ELEWEPAAVWPVWERSRATLWACLEARRGGSFLKKKEKEGERERGGGGKGKNGRQPKQSSRDCRVEKREMRVRDLGLGFDSDEIVLFKFCVGSCQSSRTNYDLALKALLENGSLPRRTARKVSSHPCCRPDRYEPVSFMDAQTTWRTIQSLSAASCMCMG